MPRTARLLRPPLFVVAAVLLASLVSAQRRVMDFDSAKKMYDESLSIAALSLRARGIEVLASTGDARAITILERRYRKPEEPTYQIKYLVAGSLGEMSRRPLSAEGAGQLWTFARSMGADLDAWLKFNALRVHIAKCGGSEAFKSAESKVGCFERAAALEALAQAGKLEALAVVEKLASAKLSGTALEQRVLFSACASALMYLSNSKDKPEFAAAARPLIMLLDHKKIEEPLKLVIARHLSYVFNTEKLWISAEPWLKLLESKPAEDPDSKTVARRPTFFGLEGRGKRTIYVIDLSDSMLKKLSGAEIEDIKKRTPVTGPGGEKPDPKKPGLPWDKIKTRFDAAREVLKLSLRELPNDVHFAVVMFGTNARLLNATQRLVPAALGNVAQAINELDNIRPGSPTEDRPEGVLMGDTNMHAGLVRAFRMAADGLISGEDEHVNAKTFFGGCDTIFVLSDGDPNTDDYPGLGPIEKNRGSWDAESGKMTKGDGRDTQYTYHGPYAQDMYLLRDLRRMNLFRKVEINCVGVGESNDSLLVAIARNGLGTVAKVGKDSTSRPSPVPAPPKRPAPEKPPEPDHDKN